MSLEENKAVVRRLFEAENEKNLALLDEVMAPDYVDNVFHFTSLEEYKKMHTKTMDALPDFRETIEDIVAEGDKVWVHFKAEGTHLGEYRGIAPTGKKMKIEAVLIYRVVDGKITEKESGTYDFLNFYKQLGVIEYIGFPDEVT